MPAGAASAPGRQGCRIPYRAGEGCSHRVDRSVPCHWHPPCRLRPLPWRPAVGAAGTTITNRLWRTAFWFTPTLRARAHGVSHSAKGTSRQPRLAKLAALAPSRTVSPSDNGRTATIATSVIDRVRYGACRRPLRPCRARPGHLRYRVQLDSVFITDTARPLPSGSPQTAPP